MTIKKIPEKSRDTRTNLFYTDYSYVGDAVGADKGRECERASERVSGAIARDILRK